MRAESPNSTLIRMSTIASKVLAAQAEKEVERLLRKVLPDSPYRGKAFSVGGYVRDELLGIDSDDLDIVVEEAGGAEGLTKWLHERFPGSTTTPYELGKGYPIWQITFKGDTELDGEEYKTSGAVIEFADAMKESYPDPESRQRITEPGTIKEDVARRDFTVNMLLRDLTSGEVVDLTGQSKTDVEKGVLRGHPEVSLNKMFSDDPVRMLRLIRFQTKYGWDIPKEVLKAVRRNAHRIDIISAERITKELDKVMKLGKLAQAVRLMKATGLLEYVLPEINALRGVQQSEKHHAEGDVYKHTLMVLQHAKPTVEDQLAALLHDVGKPATQEFLEDKIRFLGHEDVGAEMAEAVLRRLRYPKKTIDRVVQTVQNHMRAHSMSKSGPKGIRKFIRELGDEIVDSVLDLTEADELGRVPSQPENIELIRNKVREVREAPVQVKPTAVLNGHEIMEALGFGQESKDKLPLVGKSQRFLIELADEYADKGEELMKEEAVEAIQEEFGDEAGKTGRIVASILAY